MANKGLWNVRSVESKGNVWTLNLNLCSPQCTSKWWQYMTHKNFRCQCKLFDSFETFKANQVDQSIEKFLQEEVLE